MLNLAARNSKRSVHKIRSVYYTQITTCKFVAQSAGAVEHTNCLSTEW